MSNLVYLGIVVVVSAIGLTVLWARSRPPSSPNQAIDEFQEKMRALAPDEPVPGDRVRRRRRGT
jgi:hypothetical protein